MEMAFVAAIHPLFICIGLNEGSQTNPSGVAAHMTTAHTNTLAVSRTSPPPHLSRHESSAAGTFPIGLGNVTPAATPPKVSSFHSIRSTYVRSMNMTPTLEAQGEYSPNLMTVSAPTMRVSSSAGPSRITGFLRLIRKNSAIAIDTLIGRGEIH